MSNDARDEPEAEPLVLGAQMAAARAAEARHRARVDEPSALAGVTYGPRHEDLSLLHFTVVAVDEVIDDFATGFAARASDERDRCRSGLTMDDFYTLLAYAQRAAVRAIRSGDEAVAQRGLAALAAIDLERVDWRDVAWQAGLLSYAIHRIGGKTGGAFDAAASLASGETAAFLTSLARQPPADLSDWGFREVSTGGAAGLIEDDGEPYQPQADLVALAEAVAARMRGDIWQLGDPVTGSALPAVWFRRGQADELEDALASITGCVKLQGSLAGQDPSSRAQHMLIFLAETKTTQAASTISAAAGPGGDSSFAAFGVAEGTLSAVMIARSFVDGTPSLETQASLERFRPALTASLTG
jgi:hypothetical protein